MTEAKVCCMCSTVTTVFKQSYFSLFRQSHCISKSGRKIQKIAFIQIYQQPTYVKLVCVSSLVKKDLVSAFHLRIISFFRAIHWA